MWLPVFLSVLAFVELRSGVYGDIELITTSNAYGIDSHSAETDSSSLGHEHSTYTSEVNVPKYSNFEDVPDGILYEHDPFQQLGVVNQPQSGYFLEEDYELVEPTFEPYKQWAYPIFKDSLLRAASNEDILRLFFEIFNKPTSKRNFIDGIFYTRSRKISAREATDDNVYPASTDGTLDDVYHDSADGALDDGVYQVSTDGNTDDGADSTQGTDHESVDLDSSSWDSVARSGLVFNEGVSTDTTPVQENCDSQCKSPLQVGSIRGIPGEHFPDYSEIPITSFSCADKKRIPGFYADLETGCQVFHVCWPHRRESFLCPIGTTFNQPILACDYWYSTNCSLAPLFFDIHVFSSEEETSTVGAPESTMNPITVSQTEQTTEGLPKVTKPTATPSTQPSVEYQSSTSSSPSSTEEAKLTITDWIRISKFLPVKSKIVVYPVSTKSKDVSIAKQKLIPVEKLKQKNPVPHEDTARKLEKQRKVLKDLIGLAENVAREAQSFIASMKLDTKPTFEKTKLAKAKSQAPVQTEKVVQKPVPKINQRFVVKPVGSKETMTTVTSSAAVKPVKLIKLRKALKPSKHSGFIKQIG